MDIKIVFKHLEHTPSLDERIREKSNRLEKYVEGISNLQWTCFTKDGFHIAEIKLVGPKMVYHATAQSDCLYKSLDKVVGKLERQLSKKKERWKKRKSDTSVHDLSILEPEVAWQDYDEDEFDDAA